MFLLCFLSALEFSCNPKCRQKGTTTVFERKMWAWPFQRYLRVKSSQRKKALPRALPLHGCQRFLSFGGQLAIAVWFVFTKSLFRRRQFASKDSSCKTSKGPVPQVLLSILFILLLFCDSRAGWMPCPNTILILVHKEDQINQCRLDFILGNSWR